MNTPHPCNKCKELYINGSDKEKNLNPECFKGHNVKDKIGYSENLKEIDICKDFKLWKENIIFNLYGKSN